MADQQDQTKVIPAAAPEVAKKEKAEKVKVEKPKAEVPAAKKEKKTIEKLEFVNTTPYGEKKDMSSEMLSAYHPNAVEASWDAWWSTKGFYKADAKKGLEAGEGGRFVMVIPPPNVTGSLHLGHALTSSIEDCMTRWHRMQGKPTLWLPGTDHAGIATQAVVEKRLMKERNQTRHDLGREAFVKEVWKWKEEYGGRITNQLKTMGVSTDWTREAFTMDDNLSKAVTEAFVRLHEKKLLYRDTKLVNWCCRLQTAISDIEVEYLDIEKRTRLPVPGHDTTRTYEFGVLTAFAYKVIDPATPDEEIVVATTRPETMLGDSAVAVHPTDERYKHLHGKLLQHPFFPDRKIPVITDAELVDPAFGTGAVKITPAHDPNDYKCGKKHGLPFITVFTEDGKINQNGGEFAGMMRFDARFHITKALEDKGLLRGKTDNKMRLGICSRSGDVIEPLIKPQWYVSCAGMGKAAVDAVRNGDLKLVPENHNVTWYSWLENIQDWCISRQLWWGHRIPAYLIHIDGQAPADKTAESAWVIARSVDEAMKLAVERTGKPASSISLVQDEDVLDTWFSSALFPFATMGWPNEEHPDFKGFYPNSVLETGHDILFFWVARMVMMGMTLTDKLPFKTVYLHAMVRDKHGRKMTKSLGNVIDPLEVISGCDLESLHQRVRDGNLPAKEVEIAIKGQKLDFPDGIPECGTDALRFGLLAYTVQGRDINLDISRIVGYRQFCNKLWNATVFALRNFPTDQWQPEPLLDVEQELATSPHLAARDKWILSRLHHATTTANQSLTDYSFAGAANAIYDFWLYDLCDYYLELIKPLMNGDESAATGAPSLAAAQRLSRLTLWVCLEHGLRLLHPFMPYLSEELWQRLPGRGKAWKATGEHPDPESVMVAPYPKGIAGTANPVAEADFDIFKDIIRTVRSLRTDADLVRSKPAPVYLVLDDSNLNALKKFIKDIQTLGMANEITVCKSSNEVEDGCSVGVLNDKVSVYLLLKGIVDPATEINKLNNKEGKIVSELTRIKKRIESPGYVDKAPEDVRKADVEMIASLEQQVAIIADLKVKYESWIKKD